MGTAAPRCCFGATPLVGELPRSNGQTTAWPSAPSRTREGGVNGNGGERWNQAHEERGHYRLVLGMPNQNDLLGELKSMQELGQTSLTRACLDFSPISRCNKDPE
jgi:hypothetical protein